MRADRQQEELEKVKQHTQALRELSERQKLYKEF